MDSLSSPWYSLDWFSLSTLKSFTWTHVDLNILSIKLNFNLLYAIIAVPLLFIFRWLIRYYANQKLPVALIKSDLKSSPLNWLRFIPEIIAEALRRKP